MWGKAFMAEDIEEVLLSEEQIKKRVQELGDQISKDYDGQEIIVLCVLKGASIFFADLIRAITDMSFPNIGKIMGRDHSTIMSSIDAIERKMQSDSMFSLEISELKKEITGQ